MFDTFHPQVVLMQSETEPSQKEEENIWFEINKEFNERLEAILAFQESKNKDCQVPLNPHVQYLEDNIFTILDGILEKTILKAIETKSLKYHKSPFNAIDYIAELLWNLNPRCPERQVNPTYIFDMDWVKKLLETRPRPYFPFSWIWSKDFAATKIQSYIRAYLVRRRRNVQEMRQFWKVLKKEERGKTVNRLPSVMLPSLPFYEKPLV